MACECMYSKFLYISVYPLRMVQCEPKHLGFNFVFELVNTLNVVLCTDIVLSSLFCIVSYFNSLSF